jgi:hypothetical protein
MDSLAADSLERNGSDSEAQQAARDAIMAIPRFPELERRLISELGPTSEAIMIHQLVYWFSKPKMQHRWSAYKTYKEWKGERGLNRKQVDKGRKRLDAKKLVEMKYSNYKRITYRVDWVRLAELLQIPLKGGQSYDLDDLENDDFDDLLEEPLYPLKGGQSSSDAPKGGTVHNDAPPMDDTPDTYAENSSFGGVQSNARDYALAYEQDNSLLQRAPEPAFAEPGAQEMNKEIEPKDSSSSPPVGDKRHSQEGEAPSQKQAAREQVQDAVALKPPKPDDDTLLAEVREVLDPDSGRWWGAKHISDRHAPEKVAEYLAGEDELPYDGRAAELEPLVRYVLWEASEVAV